MASLVIAWLTVRSQAFRAANVNPAKVPKLSLTELNKLTVPNLRIKLEELGLDTKGRRIFFLTYAEAPLFLEIFFLKPQLDF